MNQNDSLSRPSPSSAPSEAAGRSPLSPSSFSRRRFLRASSSASVATVLAMNGLIIDVRADGPSSGSTYKPDYKITFNQETEIESDVGEMDLSAAQGWAAENGGTGEDSGSKSYDPATETVEETGGGQPEWSQQPTESNGKLIIPAGTTLTIKNVRVAVPK
jgi:hypothetical protein